MSEEIDVDCGQATLRCLVDGAAGAPVVLCAHGFPDGARSFRHQVAPLVGAGFRVVRPWLRGYAPSSLARDGRYDVAAIAEDLCALATRLSREPVRLVGHDWGAIAGYAAAARAPHRFSHLVTVAVPHLRVAGRSWGSLAQLRRSWYMGLFQARGLAERIVAREDFAFIDRLWRDWSPGWQAPPEELAAVKDGFRGPEHLRAVLGYYRAIVSLRGLLGEPRRLLLAPTTVPALYVHGDDDGCAGVELCRGVEAAYRAGVRVHRVPRAGHFVHQEQPQAFNALVLPFLTQ